MNFKNKNNHKVRSRLSTTMFEKKKLSYCCDSTVRLAKNNVLTIKYRIYNYTGKDQGPSLQNM